VHSKGGLLTEQEGLLNHKHDEIWLGSGRAPAFFGILAPPVCAMQLIVCSPRKVCFKAVCITAFTNQSGSSHEAVTMHVSSKVSSCAAHQSSLCVCLCVIDGKTQVPGIDEVAKAVAAASPHLPVQARVLVTELRRASLLWEEAWHTTLSELQVNLWRKNLVTTSCRNGQSRAGPQGDKRAGWH
jgi:hypothetical protein